MRNLLAVLLLFQALTPPQDLDELLAGVSKIAAPGAPGPLCVYGERAFAVVAGGSGARLRAPVVAAAEWGKGRVVAFGHNGYFANEAIGAADTGTLLANAARWAGRGKLRIAVGGWSDLAAHLKKQGMETILLKRETWRDGLAACDVAAFPPDWPASAEDVQRLAAFIQGGGGFLSGVPGWGWQSLNGGKTLVDDFPGNRLLAPAGLVWADGTLDRTADGGYSAERPSPLLHAAKALETLAGKPAKEDLAQAGDTLTRAARALPASDPLLLPKLRDRRQSRGPITLDAEHPLKADAGLDRVLLALEVDELRKLPPSKVKAHPAAASFPGSVPAGAARVTRKVGVDAKIPAWHSTGLYAVAGEPVTVVVPDTAVKAKLQVRIGAHTDGLWKLDSWKRVPEISQRWPLSASSTVVASAFGGLVYIDVPDRCPLGTIDVEISGAVDAPFFVLGTTTPAAWKELRQRPGPWAELATAKVILTIPSRVIRDFDQPAEVLEFWDRMLDACADLASIPRARPRPERYAADVQISAGYMHSGYPIMTHLDVEKAFVDVKHLMKDGWGFYHEMGHNHQAGDWTFEGTGEVTNNLFSVYICETLCLQAEGHPGVRAERRRKSREKHLAAGSPFDAWKADPFLALDQYLLMQEAFGWETFKKVFAEYRTLAAAERPKSDADKRDQWMVRFSRAAGRNLGPYFQAWGVPTSEAARQSIAELPGWMPENFPARK